MNESRKQMMRRHWRHCIAVGVVLQIALAVWADPPRGVQLRNEIEAAIAQGNIPGALQAAQAALGAAPNDPDVQREYVDLHLSLARVWIEAGHFRSATTTLDAVQRVAPDHVERLRLQRAMQLRKDVIAGQLEEVDRLLEYHRYFDAHARLTTLAAEAGDEAPALHARLAVALLGMGDQYLLADAPLEAWRAYEQHLAGVQQAPRRWVRRWMIALALTLQQTPQAIPGSVRDLLQPRLGQWREGLGDEQLVLLTEGFLAQADGRTLAAGQAWADGLGKTWELPAVERRAATVAGLGRAARLALQTERNGLDLSNRPSAWRVVLGNIWKRRDSAHFQARARNDIVADTVLQAATFHARHLSEWLGLPPQNAWTPRCELVVHGDLERLQAETGLGGATRAVTHSKVQGKTILQRRVHLHQDDPWLLASTLPHELTHVLVQQIAPGGLPLAIDEGLALQTEPPARQLQFRRAHAGMREDLTTLLRVTEAPDPPGPFYAQSLELVDFLLHHASVDSDRNPRRRLIEAFTGERWYEALGWGDLPAAERAWRLYLARRPIETMNRASAP